MDFDETMVENEFDDVEADDTLPDDIVEEDESYEDEDFPDEEELEIPDEESDEESSEEEAEPEPEEVPPSEPGWMKKRIGKAVEKAVRETEARMQALFEKQMAPIREKMIEDEAQALVASRKVADIETARELVRYRQGQAPVAEKPQETVRDDQGRFASRDQIAEKARTEARIDELHKQAQKIKANGGPDVIKEFSSNEDIKRRVVNGELDFYDVADMMKKPKRKPPAPVRSSNGAGNISSTAFDTMSDAQFERLEKQIDRGVRYKLR